MCYNISACVTEKNRGSASRNQASERVRETNIKERASKICERFFLDIFVPSLFRFRSATNQSIDRCRRRVRLQGDYTGFDHNCLRHKVDAPCIYSYSSTTMMVSSREGRCHMVATPSTYHLGFLFHKNRVQSCAAILYVPRRDWKRSKGCVFSPPSLRPVPARGREARKRNLSIASHTTPLNMWVVGVHVHLRSE